MQMLRIYDLFSRDLFSRIEPLCCSDKDKPHCLHSLGWEQASCSITWVPFQSALIAVEEILSILLPPIGLLFPAYTPILVGLMLGCTALTSRLHPGFGGNDR